MLAARSKKLILINALTAWEAIGAGAAKRSGAPGGMNCGYASNSLIARLAAMAAASSELLSSDVTNPRIVVPGLPVAGWAIGVTLARQCPGFR